MSSDPPPNPVSEARLSSQPELSSSASLADDIRKQVENEQALADALRKLKEVEDEVERVRQEKVVFLREKKTAIASSSTLQSQLSTLQSSHYKTQSELSVLQTRLDAIDREKRELLEETERLQQRSNRNTQELFTLRSQRTESSQKIAHLDVEVSELKMMADSAKFSEGQSKQALLNARGEIVNLNKSVSDAEERFSRYRAQKQGELSELQMEHDSFLGRATAAENSHRALQRTYNDQSRRLAEAHANIASLASAAAAKKASTSSEFARLTDEYRIVEKRGEEARATVAEREAELERMVDAQSEKERSMEERWKKEERLRRDAEKRSEDLKVVVERLSMAHGDGSELSPAAALAHDQRQNGKSYTQFYMDYTIQESKLRAAENEVTRLTQLLDEISADISEKKPLLDEQAAEHGAAIERANILASELSTVMTARDRHEAEAKSLKADANLRSDEIRALRSTADDLSRQVQALLRQIAIHNDPSLVNEIIDGDKKVAEGDIITDHLVEFKSIRSLQEQNEKLLRLTRGLMAKLDAQEIGRATSNEDDINTGATLDQATDTITKLHAQLIDAQKKINEVTRERDSFSKLLARGEGLKRPVNGQSGNGPLDDGPGPQQQMVVAMQEEMEMIRVKAEQDVQEAKKEARVKADAAGQAEVGKARAEAQITLLYEQHRLLGDGAALQKREYVNLESQLRQVQHSIAQANKERRSALEEVASRQAEADRLRNEASNLRAEKEQWQSTESRLQSDFRSVQSERARLQQLIDGLNNVTAEYERTRVDERTRLERRVEGLQREATTLRGQIETAKESARAAEKRSEDFNNRLETATASVRAEKDAAESLATSRVSEISKLQAEVESTKTESDRRLRAGLNYQKRKNELVAELAKSQEVVTEKDKEIAEITAKIESVNKEIDETKIKVVELEKKLADSERGSQLKDATVTRLQSELIKAQSGQSGQSAQTTQATTSQPDFTALTALQGERDSLQEKLNQAEKDLVETKAAASAASAASAGGDGAGAAVAPAGSSGLSDEERTELHAKVDQLQKDKEGLDQKYENDVRQVNRVNAQLRNRVVDLQSEKSGLETRMTELEKRIADLQAANANAANTVSADGTTTSGPDASAVDEAVRNAVVAREAELKAEHAKELEAAKSTHPDASTSTSANSDLQAKKAELEAKQLELETSFNTRLNEAVSVKSSEKEQQREKEKNDLIGQIEQLTQKVKTLERQNKTAEISRKTLERRKADAEARLKKVEEGGVSTPTPGGPASATTATSATAAPPSAGTPATGLSAGASEFKPTEAMTIQPAPTSTPAAVSPAPTPAAVLTSEAASSRTATRGGVRGRGRGAVSGGRGAAVGARANSILNTVNQALAQSAQSTQPVTAATSTSTATPAASSTTPASSTSAPISTPNISAGVTSPSALGNKRPLPEDGEISEHTGAGAGASGTGPTVGEVPAGTTGTHVPPGGGRVLKRPRGTGPRGGGRGGRRPSGPSGAGDGATGTRGGSQGGDSAAGGDGAGGGGGDGGGAA